MLKGVSRQIVEITDTNNPFFERAFLVVRRDCTDQAPEILDQQARRLLSAHLPYSGLKRSRRFSRLRRVGLLVAGSGIGWALSLLLHP